MAQQPKKEKANNRLRGNKKYTQFVHPMLARLSDEPFDDKEWIFEIKWDGYRAITEINKGKIKLYSRNGISLEENYPPVFDRLQKIKHDVVLDGEIVVLNKQGKPSFQMLQQFDQHPEWPIQYYVFDLLTMNGKNLYHIPLIERKKLLKKIVPSKGVVLYCDHVLEKGLSFFSALQKKNLEGMIAKKKDSHYYPGKRNGEWLKIKIHQGQEAVIAGFTAPRGSRKYFGALVLGVYKNGKLFYTGHTGTGFSESVLKEVYQKLKPLIVTASPFSERVVTNAPVTWVKPVLVANIEFTELTAEGQMRHPVFQGLRTDKSAKEVKKEKVYANKKVVGKTQNRKNEKG